MKNQSSKGYLWISILMHTLFLVSLSKLPKESPANLHSTSYLPAYLHQTILPHSQAVKTTTKRAFLNGQSKEGTLTHLPLEKLPSVEDPRQAAGNKFEKKAQHLKSSRSLQLPHLQQSINSHPSPLENPYISEKNIDKPLLQLLHNIIADHLDYPSTALELSEEGVVQVGFLLSPDGHISDIKLIHSSGFDLLDRAALNAVTAISPVTDTHRYLSQASFLAINVTFKTHKH